MAGVTSAPANRPPGPRVSYKSLLDWAEAHVQALTAAGIASWHVLRAEMIRDGLKEREPDRIHGWPIQRLYDMVRYARHMLHDDRLLTNEEYGALVGTGADSARRLEAYDALQERAERRGAALVHLARLEPAAEVDPHGILRAAVDVARAALAEHPVEEADEWPRWLVRWMSGEQLGCSTGIDGGPTYGYGELDANGFWQVPVPAEFADALYRHARAYVERNKLVPRPPVAGETT